MPLIAMPIFSAVARIGRELLRAGLGRQVVFEVVVQLDAVEAGVLRELEALLQGHLLGIGERPEVDRLLEAIFLALAGCPWPETATAPNIAADAASNSRRSG